MTGNRHSLRIAAAMAVTATIVACSGTGKLPPSQSAAGLAASPGAAATPAPVHDALLVVARPDQADLDVILASTGQHVMTLPSAIPDQRWGHLVTATPAGSGTRVQQVDLTSGLDAPDIVPIAPLV